MQRVRWCLCAIVLMSMASAHVFADDAGQSQPTYPARATSNKAGNSDAKIAEIQKTLTAIQEKLNQVLTKQEEIIKEIKINRIRIHRKG